MKTIALSAGHTKGTGAVAHDGTPEWEWNTQLADKLEVILRRRGYKVLRLRRSRRLGYTAAMRELGRQMRKGGADIALELHFNHSSNPKANGYEFLHWWGSARSQSLAQHLGISLGVEGRGLKRRGSNYGARSLWFHRWNADKAYSRRGGAYCYLTPCPAVICEPGFASHEGDWRQLKDSIDTVAMAYAEGIEDYFKFHG